MTEWKNGHMHCDCLNLKSKQNVLVMNNIIKVVVGKISQQIHNKMKKLKIN